MKPRRNSLPYWRFIAAGRHLGYRPHRSVDQLGSWCARLYLGGRSYSYATLGTADDRAPADGEAVLNHRQALEKAQAWFDQEERRANGLAPRESEPYTVERCLLDYLDWYAAHRKALANTRHAVEAHILPALGQRQVASLTPREIREWHQELARTRPRLRSVVGTSVKFREIDGPEGERQRKATANRILTILKAALNFAFSEGRVDSDLAWRRVRPFKGVDAARVSFLDQDQARSLLKSCAPDFRDLVEGALLTGCRYGELIALQVSDFRPEVQAIHVCESKSGKSRHVYLGDEAVTLFKRLTGGRVSRAFLFVRADGLPWGDSHQDRRMKEACAAAKIEPGVSFHILRHTYASHYLMGGGSLPALAAQLGHADTRMTIRHYGHLAESWRAAEARQHGPRLAQA